ncbi:MAG: hypothetical protein AAGL49_05935, partial [Pseudomonadota bacterium]
MSVRLGMGLSIIPRRFWRGRFASLNVIRRLDRRIYMSARESCEIGSPIKSANDVEERDDASFTRRGFRSSRKPLQRPQLRKRLRLGVPLVVIRRVG